MGNGTLSRTLSTNVYDHRGLLSTLLYGNGASVSYTYDALGRTVQTAFGDTPAFAYAYLADGKTGLAIDYINGHRTRYGYDFAGRLASLVRTAGGDDGARILQLDYTYEDAANRLQKLVAKWQAASVTDSYTYGNAANGQMPDAVYRLQSVVAAGDTSFTFSRNYSYDALGRLAFAGYGNTPNGITFTYAAGSGENQTTARIAQLSWINQSLSYTYDANGNITSVSQNGALLERYAYDALGQLVRVDSTVTDTTTLFVYDAGGNLQSRSVYPFAEGEPTGTPDVVVYGYNDASWADLLTAYDGQPLTYDAIGNPLQWRDGMTFTWQNGRQLAAFAADSVSASYTYGEGGIRTAKTVTNADGSVTNITYHTAGGSPLGESRITTLNGETVSTVEIQYVYDASGTAYGISAFVTDAENNTTQYNYYYMHNLQGDVIGLWHQYAGPICYYTYDAWGKLLSVTDANGNAITDANHIAHINPIRYRSYYYDTESGLYYVSSRYYDPEIGRWISPEPNVDYGEFDEGAGLLGYNVYAYCANNPVMFKDETGESIILACVLIFGGIGLLTGGHFAAKASKAKLGYVNGWWVLGGMVVGGGVGALFGWGVGSAAAAIGAKLAAGSSGTLGKVIYSSWQSAEKALRTAYKGAKATFNTPWGKRVIDSYSKNVIREAKYGYQGLSKFIQQEINKDVWILKNTSVKSIEWHFYWSSVSNSGGPSGSLLKELARYGIKVIFH